jgi:hypothetical protein
LVLRVNVSDNPGAARPTAQVSVASGHLHGRLLWYVPTGHTMLLCITYCSALQTVVAASERKRSDSGQASQKSGDMAGTGAGEPPAAIALMSETTHLTI